MEAYIECRRHKRNTLAAIAFEVDLERNLLRLYEDINSGCYRISPSIGAIHKWGTLSSMRLLTPGEMLEFRNSINSYWGLMKHHSSYRLRKKMSGKFTSQINNRISYSGYCKISMQDYTPTSGGRMIPYEEWWEQFERDKKTDIKTKKYENKEIDYAFWSYSALISCGSCTESCNRR